MVDLLVFGVWFEGTRNRNMVRSLVYSNDTKSYTSEGKVLLLGGPNKLGISGEVVKRINENHKKLWDFA